jgi:DNA polymerase-3 subunit beta
LKLSIAKVELLNLISKTQNIVEKRNTMPVLINVLLDAQKGKLKIYATNLEVSLTDEAEAHVAQPGRVAVNAKNLFDIVKEMSDGDVELIKLDNNWLKIVQGKSVFNIVGISPDEYPVFPVSSSKDYMEIDAKVLADMIGKTIYSVSNDETRYHLNGVYFEKKLGGSTGSSYLMVATDGHRLSLVNRDSQALDSKTTEGVIIPRKGLSEIYKLLESLNGKFKMAIEGSQLVVMHGSTVLMVRLIEGKYPNYRQLIPQNLSQQVFIKREALLSSLKRVSLLSNQKSKGVTLNFSKGRLEITSNNPELGDAKEEIEVDYKGDNLKIGFNAKYIMDVLTSVDDDEIRLDLKDQLSPGVMRSNKDKDYTCVIMPMRI